MDCPFYVGQRVTPHGEHEWYIPTTTGNILHPNPPKFGAVYTIIGFSTTFPPTIGIYLDAVKTGMVGPDLTEGAWDWTAFRPVRETKTDTGMGILREIARTGTLGLDALDPVEEHA